MLNIRGSSFLSSVRLRGVSPCDHATGYFFSPQLPARKVPEAF